MAEYSTMPRERSPGRKAGARAKSPARRAVRANEPGLVAREAMPAIQHELSFWEKCGNAVNMCFLMILFHLVNWHPASLELVDLFFEESVKDALNSMLEVITATLWNMLSFIIVPIVVFIAAWICINMRKVVAYMHKKELRTRGQKADAYDEKENERNSLFEKLWERPTLAKLTSVLCTKGTWTYVRTWVTIFVMLCVLSFAAINFPVCSEPGRYLQAECAHKCPKRGVDQKALREGMTQCMTCKCSLRNIEYRVRLQCQTIALAPQVVGGAFGKVVVRMLQFLSGKEHSCKRTSVKERAELKARHHEEKLKLADDTGLWQTFRELAQVMIQKVAISTDDSSVLNWVVYNIIPQATGITPPSQTPSEIGYTLSVIVSIMFTIVLIVIYMYVPFYASCCGLLMRTGTMACGKFGVYLTYYSCPDLLFLFITSIFNHLCTDSLDVSDMALKRCSA